MTTPKFHGGGVRLSVRATDVFDRTSEHHALLNLTDLSAPHSDAPGVYFDDSTVGDDGAIRLDAEHPVSGYFIGGTARSVEIVPATRAATARLEGNSIILTPGTGGSGQVTVRVTTTSGATYSSRPLYFVAQEAAPVLTLDPGTGWNTDAGTPFDAATASSLRITGSVQSASTPTVRYRILGAQATVQDGVVTGSSLLPVPSLADSRTLPLGRGNTFTLNLAASDFDYGMYVVELVATNASGQQSVGAVAVRKLPAVDGTGSDGAIQVAAPSAYWVKGVDWYALGVYQGIADSVFRRVREQELPAGLSSLSFTLTPQDAQAQPVTAQTPVSQQGSIDARIVSVDGTAYTSGMPLYMQRGPDDTHVATLSIRSGSAVSSVRYTVSGEQFAGGRQTLTGAATVTPRDDGTWQADIPLADLPARTTVIQAQVQDALGNAATVSGTVLVLRRHEPQQDGQPFVWGAGAGSVYDASRNQYVLGKDAALPGFLAVPAGSISATVTGGGASLTAQVEGSVVRLVPVADGTYANVSVRITNAAGGVWTTPPVTIVADSQKPQLAVTSPQDMAYLRDTLTLTGTVTDASGIQSLQYTTSDAATNLNSMEYVEDAPDLWHTVDVARNGAFSVQVVFDGRDDGYLPLTLKATDTRGQVTYWSTALHKDTTPPAVTVIVPEPEAVINGETLIAFAATDDGALSTVTFSGQGGAAARFSMEGQGQEPPATADMADLADTALTVASSLPHLLVGTAQMPLSDDMVFAFADKAGNVTTLRQYDFTVDAQSDLPVAEIHLPAENEVITKDFVISGVIYDDDGPCTIYYAIDGGAYQQFDEPGHSFRVNVPLSAMTDNEHVVRVYAEDIHGVRGLVAERTFRVSLEEPKGGMQSPTIDMTVKGIVTLRGIASDKNGIQKVQLSLDNGASYNDAVGGENWTYTFDTRAIPDGSHAVFVRIWDNYDIIGLYSSLLNIDNTSPTIKLELPLDDSVTTRNVFFSGQTTDNIALSELYITVRSLDAGRTVPASLSRIDLEPSEIITQVIDLGQLADGFYNIELTGTDAAGNITRVSRNVQLDKAAQLNTASLMYPLNAQSVQGTFNVYGLAQCEEDRALTAELYVDGQKVDALGSVQVTDTGYFAFRLSHTLKLPDTTARDEEGNKITVAGAEFTLEPGQHEYYAVVTTEGGKRIATGTQTLSYSPYGPWVTLDNFTYGDFAVDRPMLRGQAGYDMPPEDAANLKNKGATKTQRETAAAMAVEQIYLSLDNGRTYQPVAKPGKDSWKYRVESEDIEPGYHFLLVKAVMKNGEAAITRAIVQVDRTPPQVTLISPGMGGRYNQELAFHGLASDDVELKDVTLMLRPGDKRAYEMPAFIKGLFFDVSLWGATLWNVGVGLTAFDNAVKIELSYGQFTQPQRDLVSNILQREQTNLRFGGQVVGLRIIAQVLSVPFMYFFGRDWEWLSATLAVGANFSFFSQTSALDPQTHKPVPQILSALLMQLEFPRMTFKKMKRFKTWAVYLEPQLWFIPSDIASDEAHKVLFTMSLGLHVNVF